MTAQLALDALPRRMAHAGVADPGPMEPASSAPAHATRVEAPTTRRPGAGPDARPGSLTSFLDSAAALLDAHPTDIWAGVDAGTVRGELRRLSQVVARLGAHQVAAARSLEASGAASRAGMTSTGALIAADFGGDRAAAERISRAAADLEEAQASATERALSSGQITTTQAGIIAGALAKLPERVSERQRQECESNLLRDAERQSVGGLRHRADRALDDIAPPAEVDAQEHDLVRARERRARARTELSMTDNNDGTWSGRFTFPDLAAHLLKTVLDGHAAPRRAHLGPDNRDERSAAARAPYPARMGQAFVAMIEHLPTDGFAHSGGAPATVAITLDHEALAAELDEAGIAVDPGHDHCGISTTGLRVSAGELRRLACEHQVLPQVLGGASLPLDLGRRSRLFSTAQRVVLAQRDQGCAFPHCDRPSSWCEAHHAGRPWSRGGTTDIDQGVLLCSYHHHQVHDQHWQIRFDPEDGYPEFRHPTQSRWQQNSRYRLVRPGDTARRDPGRVQADLPGSKPVATRADLAADTSGPLHQR